MKLTKLTIYFLTFFLALTFANSVSAAITIRPTNNLGLVGYWSMDEGTGTVVGDSSGNQNDGNILSKVAGDDFNRANEDPLSGSSNWTTIPGLNKMKLVSNQAVGYNNGTTGHSGSVYTGASFSSDQYSSATFASVDEQVGLYIHTSNTVTQTGYLAYAHPLNGETYAIYRYDNGTLVYLANHATQSAVAGDRVTFMNVGSQLRLYVNGELILTGTDTTYTSGYPGIKVFQSNISNKAILDNWEGGDITGTWVDGKRGKALNFDGTNDYVDMGDPGDGSLDFGASQDFTVVTWVKTKQGQVLDQYPQIVSKVGTSGGGYEIALHESTTSARWYGNIWVGGTKYGVNGSSDVADGQWHQLVFMRSGSNILTYQDGAYANTTSAVTSSLANTANFRIGAISYSNYFLDGSVDEVRVYNRALAPSEVEGLYETGAAKILAPNNTGLVGYWAMEEGTGTQAGDSSGNGNTGDITGASWTDGKRGKALSFNGTSDRVALSVVPINNIGVYTISAWFKTTKSGGGRVDIYNEGGDGSRNIDINVDEAANKVRFAHRGSGTDVVNSITSINDGQWHHVVGTRVSSGLISLYVDGTFEASDTLTGDGVINSSSAKIGSNYSGVANFFPGLIDEVRIYNRALSETEVAALYNSSGKRTEINSSQNSRLTSGLVGLWSFNGPDVSGVNAYDRSGNNNTGTITGATPAIGKVGQGMSFDGTDDYVNLGNPAVLNLNTNFTISAWVKVNFGVTNITQGIVVKGDAVTPFDTIAIRADGSGTANCSTGKCLTFRINDGTNNAESSYDAVTGTWYHVVMVVGARGAGGLRGYIDGVERVTENTSAVGDVTTTNNWYVGYNERNNHYFNGVIDEVRIYNRALSAGEVWQLYNMGGPVAAATTPWACGDPLSFTYKGGSATHGTVNVSGQCWMDRNLGASQAATAYNDSASYGDYFQWGRLDDGHQTSTSGTTATLSGTNNPGHGNFITINSGLYDWRNPQNDNLWQAASGYANNPCPSGWHIPLQTEWSTAMTNLGLASCSSNCLVAMANSSLKIPTTGRRNRDTGALGFQGTDGYYWSSSPNSTNADYQYFYSAAVVAGGGPRAFGFSARCLKD